MKVLSLFALLASTASALPSPPVPPQILNSTEASSNNLRGSRDLQTVLTVTTACIPSISISVSGGGCYGIGQTIEVVVKTCPTPFPEWIGIFAESPTNFDASSNWLYCCGNQTCAAPVEPSTYTLSFGFDSSGSASWPLSDSFGGGGGNYQIFFHTGYGTLSTTTIQITPGYFCEGPYAGVPADEIPPEFTPCPLVNNTQPCFSLDSSDSSEDSSDGDEGEDTDGGDDGEEPCEKITPGQGGTPPGQGGIPPGLQCKGGIPPGQAKKQNGNN